MVAHWWGKSSIYIQRGGMSHHLWLTGGARVIITYREAVMHEDVLYCQRLSAASKRMLKFHSAEL
jgi:hypothetical protein